jgi:hypothetical protein
VNKEQLLESGVLESYVLGTATKAESLIVEQLASIHPEIKAELTAIEEAIEQYGFANGAYASPNLKHKILSRIADLGTQVRTQKSFATHINTIGKGGEAPVVAINSSRKLWLRWAAVAAGVALLLGTGAYVNSVNKANNRLAIELENKKTELAMERNSKNASEEEMQIIHSKYTVPLKLTADHAPSKDCEAKIYLVTNTNEVYLDASNLPKAPKGKQYQLWAIEEKATIDCGLISLERNSGFQKMKSFGKVDAFAITLEKEGGVLQSENKPFVIVGNIREMFDEYHHEHCGYHKD